MKITNKQIKQIIKEELDSVMKETMIKPSNLVQKILDDPKVNSRIKEKVKKLFDIGDEERTKQALELVAAFHPEYAEEIDSTIPGTFSSDYKEKFDSSYNNMSKGQILKTLREKLKERVAKYTKRSGIKDGGTVVKNLRDEFGVYALVRTQNIDGLRNLQNTLGKQGFKVGKITRFADSYDLKIKVEVSSDLNLPEDPDDLFNKIIMQQKNK